MLVAKSSHARFSCSLTSPALSFLWDHQVSGKAMFPGAGYFEAALAAGTILVSSSIAATPVLCGVSIPAPLVLPTDGSNVVLHIAAGGGRMEVFTAGNRSGKPNIHLAGSIDALAVDVPSTRQQPAPGAIACLSGAIKIQGMAPEQEPSCTAHVSGPTHDVFTFGVSPAVLDNCLQLGAVAPQDEEHLYVPAGVKALTLCGKAQQQGDMHSVSRPAVCNGPAVGSTLTDYGLVSAGGMGVCYVGQLEAKPLAGVKRAAVAASAAATQSSTQEFLYTVDWLMHNPGSCVGRESNEEAGLADVTRLSLMSEPNPAPAIATAMAVAQCLAAAGQQAISLTTKELQPGQGLRPLGSSSKSPHAASLWGLMRTVAQEMPAVACSAVDAAASATSSIGAAINVSETASALVSSKEGLVKASTYGCSEQGGALVAAALHRSAAKQGLPPFRLFPKPRGALQNLQPEVLPSTPVSEGSLMIAVKAVGINFR